MSRRKHLDPSGKSLEDYPRPSVAVDTAVLTLDSDLGLVVLEVLRPDGNHWVLPGTFLHEHETLADAVERSLADKANVHGLRPRQLHVFDDPDRDDRGRVLSVAHIAVVQPSQLLGRKSGAARLVPVVPTGRLYGHDDIVERAVAELRTRYRDRPDPDRLLGDTFTLRELRQVHEVISGKRLQADNFRRAMEGLVVGTDELSAGGRGRPAELFRRNDTGFNQKSIGLRGAKTGDM
ncbi:NUDIX hydrolase [Mycobacterium sp. CBMA 234]|uniref:NUDIX hydrolase n=1 Tax=Mycolicibacterium sp. CBMA 234 TaxID=1918495 RepID=UPI0012DBD6A2|nr:NUDIX hydrolase [Mycolicibacterium sp. CBMA 234]MUL67547.1 NUDIX hydrolase [Mycolicibacterium sp. CBMA 234]